MTNRRVEHQTWREAAQDADFAFYELVAPAPTHRWAGGYGWGRGQKTTSLEIMHDVGGVEVTVNTTADSRRPPGEPWPIQSLVHDLTWHAIFGAEPMTLPLTVTLSAVNHTILVDGAPQVFEGVALDTGEWTASAEMANGSIVIISVRGAGVALEAIARCEDTALPDLPHRSTPGQ